MRGLQIDVTTALVTEECFQCHVLFAFPQELRTQLLEKRGPNGRQFYCPNGHEQHYIGKSEADLLRERLQASESERERAARRADRLSAEVDQERAARAYADRRRAAYQGRVTKLTKRAHAGVCAFCNRSFVNVQRHMSTKHSDQPRETSED